MKRTIRRNPVVGKHGGHLVPIDAPDEEIEVFRIAADAGVVDECERAADKEIHVVILKDLDDTLIEVRSVLAGSLYSRWRHALAQARRMP